MKTGIELIAAERKRQVTKERWTAKHDDEHEARELARAAQCYLNHYVARQHIYGNTLRLPSIIDGPKAYQSELPSDEWPWGDKFWNPQNPLRDLVKAAALIAAEIDRLQRQP